MYDLADILNRIAQEVPINSHNIYKYNVEYEILLKDLASKLKVPTDTIEEPVNMYCSRFYSSASRKMKVMGTPTSFIVIADNISDIEAVRRPLVSNLEKFINISVSNFLTTERNSVKPSSISRSVLEMGHMEGEPVDTDSIVTSTIQFNSRIRSLNGSKSITSNVLAKMNIKINTNIKDLKSGVLTIDFMDETPVNIRNSFRTAAIHILRETNWLEFDTPTAKDIAIGKVLVSLNKIGAKGANKKKMQDAQKTNTSKATKTISSKNITTVLSDELSKTLKQGRVDIRDKTSNRNWSSIIPIINARLHSQLAKNMVKPRLQYKTGRFARSVKVIGVEQTPKGYPSFIYDYERNPYDVFDPYKGAWPWNTPQRNPRNLINQSIREIMKELAIGRFYLRRA